MLQTADEYWKEAHQSEVTKSETKPTHILLERYHQTMTIANKLSLEQSALIFEKLESFYSKYTPLYGLRIITTAVGLFIRIQPEDGISQLLRNPEDKKNKLRLYLEEFNKFSNFLSKVV